MLPVLLCCFCNIDAVVIGISAPQKKQKINLDKTLGDTDLTLEDTGVIQ